MLKKRSTLLIVVLMLTAFYLSPLLGHFGEWVIETAVAQDLKSLLFSEVNQAMKEAKAAGADVLAPKTYGEAMEQYRKAEMDYNKGKNLDDIRKNIRSATSRFRRAREATKLANVALGSSIQARKDALSSEAPAFAAKLWKEAEEKFSGAARTLEEGDLKDGKKKADEAEKSFRDAELKAIKVNYLDETYTLLKDAERLKVQEFAPKTLKLAQELVKQAEKELNENRYDTDVARILARQAKREAKHAIFMAATIRDMKDKKQSTEELILAAEKPIYKIASAMDFVPSFDSGFKTPTDKIVMNVKEYQNSIARLTTDLFDSEQYAAILERRKGELEQKLSGVELERTALSQRLEKQAKIRQLYDEVEKLFTGEIAIFMREGSNIIIRTVGLSFPVGKASIDPKYYNFLGRVNQAIGMFPKASLAVEGHTDSYGSDATNLTLSIQRADAVKNYLVTNFSYIPDQIEAIGYGESTPIATNETEEGRARNRRIEVIIRPHFDEEGTF